MCLCLFVCLSVLNVSVFECVGVCLCLSVLNVSV